MSRLAGLRPEDLAADARRLREHILSGRRGGTAELTTPAGMLLGPFDALLRAPAVGTAVADLGEAVRFDTSLDRRLLELAIVRVAAHWDAPFEAAVHRRLATTAGVDEAVLDAVLAGRDPLDAGPDERCVLALTGELVGTGRVTDATYAEAVQQLGEAEVVELVLVAGYYTLIAFVLNAFDIGEDGVPADG